MPKPLLITGHLKLKKPVSHNSCWTYLDVIKLLRNSTSHIFVIVSLIFCQSSFYCKKNNIRGILKSFIFNMELQEPAEIIEMQVMEGKEDEVKEEVEAKDEEAEEGSGQEAETASS